MTFLDARYFGSLSMLGLCALLCSCVGDGGGEGGSECTSDGAPALISSILLKPRVIKDGKAIDASALKFHVAIQDGSIAMDDKWPVLKEPLKVPNGDNYGSPIYESGVAWIQVVNNAISIKAHLLDLSTTVDGQTVDGVIKGHRFYGSCVSTILVEAEFDYNHPQQSEPGQLSSYFVKQMINGSSQALSKKAVSGQGKKELPAPAAGASAASGDGAGAAK